MENKTSGKLPVTAEIELDSTTDQWLLLERKLINKLSTQGTLERNGQKVRVNIELDTVYSPARIKNNFQLKLQSSLDPLLHKGLHRADLFAHKLLASKMWVIIGHIIGTNPIKIIIIHYERFKLSIYSQQLLDEKWNQDFLEGGFSRN